MSDQKYNGWTNYETWNLALWIGNEEGSYNEWQERTREAYRNAEADATFTRKENARYALAKQLEDDTRENMPEVSGFYGDVLGAAISEVNWHEIAENWIDEIADEIDEEEREEEADDEDEQEDEEEEDANDAP